MDNVNPIHPGEHLAEILDEPGYRQFGGALLRPWPAGSACHAALHGDRRQAEHPRISRSSLDVTLTKSLPYIVETIRVLKRKVR